MLERQAIRKKKKNVSGPSGSLDNLSFIGEYMRINKTRSEFSF